MGRIVTTGIALVYVTLRVAHKMVGEMGLYRTLPRASQETCKGLRARVREPAKNRDAAGDTRATTSSRCRLRLEADETVANIAFIQLDFMFIDSPYLPG
jgi:hypothetical protein